MGHPISNHQDYSRRDAASGRPESATSSVHLPLKEACLPLCVLLIAAPGGNVIARYADLPCADREGIAFDDGGAMYISQDSGEIIRIDWAGPAITRKAQA